MEDKNEFGISQFLKLFKPKKNDELPITIVSARSSQFVNHIELRGQDGYVFKYVENGRNLAPEENSVLDRILSLVGKEGVTSTLKKNILSMNFANEANTAITIDFSALELKDGYMRITIEKNEKPFLNLVFRNNGMVPFGNSRLGIYNAIDYTSRLAIDTEKNSMAKRLNENALVA